MYKKPSDPTRPPLHLEVRASERACTFAKELRRAMSPPERLLWSRLKGGRVGGLKFRKQHPLGPWIADFYCHEAKLIVEVDGPTHCGDRRELDDVRDRWMTDRHLGVIRFSGQAVFANLENVLNMILWRAQDRLRALHSSPAPGGGGGGGSATPEGEGRQPGTSSRSDLPLRPRCARPPPPPGAGEEYAGRVIVPWAMAPQQIHRLLAERGGRLVGITGPVGAGKSTLAARLSACIVSTDHYLPNYDKVPYHRRDEPDAADLPRLAKDLASLAAGRPTSIPVWSFQTHRREGETLIHPPAEGPIVCEGLHALHDPVAKALHLRVFVEAPAGVRWARWEHLEVTGTRGWGPKVARAFFDEVAEPTFSRWAADLRASADVIVTNHEGVPNL